MELNRTYVSVGLRVVKPQSSLNRVKKKPYSVSIPLLPTLNPKRRAIKIGVSLKLKIVEGIKEGREE